MDNKIIEDKNKDCGSSYDGYDSDESYIYNSKEDNDFYESISKDEKDYFGDSSSSSEESGSEDVWKDSDEFNKSECELPETAGWVLTAPPTRIIRRKTDELNFKLTRKIFATKYKIKLLKMTEALKVAVDTFNIVYFIQKEKFKAFRIDKFLISDFVFFKEGVLLASNKSSCFKYLKCDGSVVEIKKRIRDVIRMERVGNQIYIAGTSFYKLDADLNIDCVFNRNFIDFCINGETVMCLESDGALVILDRELRFKKKLILENRFEYKRLFTTGDFYFIGREMGVTILNKHLEYVKEINNLKKPPTGLVCVNRFIIYGSDYPNSLRIVKEDLEIYPKFPFSKVKINKIDFLAAEGNFLFICHSKFITMLEILKNKK